MTLVLIFAATLLGGWVFPWWWPALAAYIIGYWFPKRAGNAFVSGFIGTALAWAAWAALLDWRNHHLLSGRIAGLFHLPSSLAVLGATGFVGGVIGGMAAWAGFSLGAYLKPKFSTPDT